MSNNEIPKDDRISKIVKKLYLQPDKADVYFVLASTGERVPAHKIVLSSASKVFDAMLYGSLKEEGDIKIVDASAEAFKKFLQFFYVNNVQLTMENISEVMYLVQKYDVMNCLSLCANFLTAKISTENVTAILDLALIFEQKELRESCELAIRSHPSKVLKSADFVECDRRVLNHIISIIHMDRLSCTEREVFVACMAWVKVISKQKELTRDIVQTHLGEVFYRIRFSLMTHDSFVELLPSYGHLFSGEEFNEILQMISNRYYKPIKFTEYRRPPNYLQKWNENKQIRCCRFVRFLPLSMTPKKSVLIEEVTTFSTNEVLLLGYFECASLYESTGSKVDRIRKVRATLLDHSGETQAQFSFDYIKGSYKVKLPNAVLIEPAKVYKLRLTFPPNSFICASGNFYSNVNFHSNVNVNLSHGIVVQYQQGRDVHGYTTVGVIDVLWFNLLE